MSKAWQRHLQMLRTEIENGNVISWRSLYRNAEAHIDNARNLVVGNKIMDDECRRVISLCRQYAEHLGDMRNSPEDRSTVNAKEIALLALKDLWDRFDIAEPSPTAKALWIEW